MAFGFLSTRRASTFLFLAPRHWISLAITGGFLFMAFSLWRREAQSRHTAQSLGLSPEYLTATWENYEQTAWIERAGERIGVYYLSIRRDDDFAQYELIMRTRLQLDTFNIRVPLEIDISAAMSERFELETFHSRIAASGVEGTAEGFIEDLRFYYRLRAPEPLVTGGGFASAFELDQPVMLAEAVVPLVTQNSKLQVGNTWTTQAANPIAAQFSVRVDVEVQALETIEIGGREFEAYRLVERAAGREVLSWYDAKGNLLRSDLGGGISLVSADLMQVFDAYPALKVPLSFEPLDREAIRSEAADSSDAPISSALPWLPNF